MAVAGDRGVAVRLGRAPRSAPTSRSRSSRRSRASSPSATSRHFGAVVGSQLPADGHGGGHDAVARPGGARDCRDRPSRRSTVDRRRHRSRCGSRATARSIGRARIQMTARIGSESDAFEDVAAGRGAGLARNGGRLRRSRRRHDHGARDADHARPASCPASAASTSSCRRRRWSAWAKARATWSSIRTAASSRRRRASLALVLAADLGDAFALPGMTPADMRAAAQRTLKEIETFQCENGGFAYWPGACHTVSPYLTAYVLHVYKTARRPQVRRRRRRARPRLRLPAARAGGAAAGRQRGVVAVVHGLAGLCGEGAGRRRPQRRTRISRGSTAIASGCRCSRWPTCTTR